MIGYSPWEVRDDGPPLTLAWARINATAVGDTQIVAAVAGRRIRVLGYCFVSSVAQLVQFQDTQATPAVFAAYDVAANGGASYAGTLQSPAFQTAVGNGLEINLGTSGNTRGHVCYVEV